MTRLRLMRPLLLSAAVVVVVGSLLGAHLLGPGGGGGTDSSGKSPPPGPAAKETVLDYWARALEWFDRYVKNAPAPAAASSGTP